MLRKGSSVKLIAAAVGYANATAFTRVFTKRLGVSPQTGSDANLRNGRIEDKRNETTAVLIVLCD
jgi:AraC-like DNA-binding protein